MSDSISKLFKILIKVATGFRVRPVTDRSMGKKCVNLSFCPSGLNKITGVEEALSASEKFASFSSVNSRTFFRKSRMILNGSRARKG